MVDPTSSLSNVRSQRRDCQHTTSVCDDRVPRAANVRLIRECCSTMKHKDIIHRGGQVQSVNFELLWIGSWVTQRCDHHSRSNTILSHKNFVTVGTPPKDTLHAGHNELCKVVLEQGQDALGFWISKATVELQHLDSLSHSISCHGIIGYHQSCIELLAKSSREREKMK